MPTVFVTAFHPLRADPYWPYFDLLVQSGIPLLLFLDERCSDCPEAPTLRVIRVPLVHAWDVERVQLPPVRSLEKDTAEFLSIMTLKLRYMAEALAYTEATHLAWIDFRVFHVIRDIPAVQAKLRSLAEHPFPREMPILAPGCWPVAPFDIFQSICWRFCGGFLLGPREAFQPAWTHQQALIAAGLPRVTWEVNYWTQMEEHFSWYPANHDDRLILNVPQPVEAGLSDPLPPPDDESTPR